MAVKRQASKRQPTSPASSDSTAVASASASEEEHEVAKESTYSLAPKPAGEPKPSSDEEDGDADEVQGSEDGESEEVEEEGEEEEEEDEEDEEEEEDDDDEEEEGEEAAAVEKEGPAHRQSAQPPQQPPPAPKKPVPSDSDADSDSSSDEPPLMAVVTRPSRAVDPSIKPISSRPMDGQPMIAALPHDHQSQKPENEPGQESQKGKTRSRKDGASSCKTPSKRKNETSTGLENGEIHKKPMFQRLWSFEDEEAILRHLVDYLKKNGTVPASSQDMMPFLDFVQGSLKIKVTKSQLQDKVRRLKKKFETNAARIRKDSDFTSSSAHERICYELSKDLWDPKEKNPKDKVVGSDSDEHDDNQSESEKDQGIKKKIEFTKQVSNGETKHSKLDIPYLTECVHKIASELSSGVALKMSLEKLDIEKASALNEKVKKLKMKEIKLQLRRIDLVKEVLKFIHESLSTTE